MLKLKSFDQLLKCEGAVEDDISSLPPSTIATKHEASEEPMDTTSSSWKEPAYNNNSWEPMNASLDQTQDRKRSSIYDYKEDLPDLKKKYERDPDFGVGRYLGNIKKNEKETFYCDLCFVELNSRETRLSHMNGVKHKMKEEREDANRRYNERCGRDYTPKGIRKIANPLGIRKKEPTRLFVKLRSTSSPIIGLDQIHEFIAESNTEIEPQYECQLCEKIGEANAMLNHLIGKDHRARVLSLNLRRSHDGLAAGQLEKKAKQYDEKRDPRYEDLVTTHFGDEEFPWPSGKAPWSIEQGGSGIPPPKSRERMRRKELKAANVFKKCRLPRLENVDINHLNIEDANLLLVGLIGKIEEYLPRSMGMAMQLDAAMCAIESSTDYHAEMKGEKYEQE